MTSVDLPILQDVYKNGAEVGNNEQARIQYNGYIDEIGNAYIRPGLANIFLPGENINAAFSFLNNYVFCVFYGTKFSLFEQSPDTDVFNQIYTGNLYSLGIYPAVSFGNKKPIYANSSTEQFIATGKRIIRYTPPLTVSEITVANAPVKATHIAYLDGYLLACDSGAGQTFTWSNLNDALTWGAYNFAAVGGHGDNLLALHVVERQIFLISSNSTEIWENDGVSPLSRISGGFIEIGCVAPYSVVRIDDSLIWLSDKRYMVRAQGRKIEKISTPYDDDFSTINITDCYADRLDIFGRTFAVFQFPNAERTIVYEPSTQRWFEWGEWDSQNMKWLAFNYKDTFFSPLSGRQIIVNSRGNGLSYFKKDSFFDQVPETSTTTKNVPIRFLRRSGYIDHGSPEPKRSNSITFRLRRGAVTSSPVMTIRWRNNGKTEWSSERVINLGSIGQTEIIRKIHKLGSYDSRQYEISVTDATPFMIGSIKEDIDILS